MISIIYIYMPMKPKNSFSKWRLFEKLSFTLSVVIICSLITPTEYLKIVYVSLSNTLFTLVVFQIVIQSFFLLNKIFFNFQGTFFLLLIYIYVIISICFEDEIKNMSWDMYTLTYNIVSATLILLYVIWYVIKIRYFYDQVFQTYIIICICKYNDRFNKAVNLLIVLIILILVTIYLTCKLLNLITL